MPHPNNQNQKAGDDSTNVQVGSVVIQQGISIGEARQIALDVFRANFYDLAGEAKSIARNRAEEITERFLKKLQEQHANGIGQAQEPDFQHALFTVQKEYARHGDRELGELLVDLLVDRTKNPSRSILQIVLNESLAVAPKLTQDQLAALSIVFLLRYSIWRAVNSHGALWDHLDRFVAPLAPLISSKDACYQHLEYSGCGSVGVGTVVLAEVFRRQYGGLFSKGFDRAQLESRQLFIPDSHPIVVKCLNDESRLQANAVREDLIRSEGERLKVSEADVSKLIALHNQTLMGQDEVMRWLIDGRSYMRNVFEVWNKSNMCHFTLTSVGIAIGHANVKRSVGEFTDLSIWIN